MKPFSSLLLVAAAVGASAVLAAPAGATSITELPPLIPGSVPQGITAGPDGNVWFVENRASRFGRVKVANDRIDDWSTGSGISADSQPSEITLGPDGNLWFTEEAGNRIGRITTSGAPTAVEFPVAGQPEGITTGPDGALWFTEFGAGRIGRITTAGAFTDFPAGMGPAAIMPLGITAGPDNNIWFTDLRFHDNPVARTTLPGVVTEFSTGITPASEPARIIAGPDGNLWFSEQTGDAIGRISPATGAVTEFKTGISTGAGPVGLTVGPDNNIWFAEYGGSSGRRIGRITPEGKVTEFASGLTGAPLDIARGPDGNLWFTENFGNRIGRVVMDPEVTTGAPSVSGSGATVPATVNSLGTQTSYALEYGPTTAYGSATNSRMIPGDSDPVNVSLSIGGLKPGTLYHYRLVAANPRGTTNGPDHTFTTAASGGGGTPSSRDTSGPKIGITSPPPASTSQALVTISLGCPLSETLGCHGSVRLETVAKLAAGAARVSARHRLVLGSARFRIKAGQKHDVKIPVSRRGRSLVRKLHHVRVRVIVTGVDASGNRQTTVTRVTLTSQKLG